MRHNWYTNNYMQLTTTSAIRYGLPIGTRRIKKRFTVSSNTYEIDLPGVTALDPEELVATLSVTAETATAPTVDFSLEEANDPIASYTRINQTAGLSTSGTTLVVDDASSIPNAVMPILLAQFTKVGNTYRLTKYEWAISSSKSSNTLTIAREFYMDGAAFSNDDFVFFSNDWSTMKDSDGNDIANTTVAVNGATTSSPIKSRLALSNEGLTGFSKGFVRAKVSAPSAGTLSYNVSLACRTRGLE